MSGVASVSMTIAPSRACSWESGADRDMTRSDTAGSTEADAQFAPFVEAIGRVTCANSAPTRINGNGNVFANACRRWARLRRARLVLDALSISPGEKVLDLGGGNGEGVRLLLPNHPGITVADIRPMAAECAARGLAFVPLDGSLPLPFTDRQFDVVFCNSVIEHVTGPKERVWDSDSVDFEHRAEAEQRAFADEIRRIGRRYVVQTPYRYFPIESHSWLPAPLALLPRRRLLPLLRHTNRWWLKTTNPDWRLLTRRDMQALFPEAKLIEERAFGLTKSLIAIG